MKNNEYYSYETVRKVHRRMRRCCQLFAHDWGEGVRSSVRLKDERGCNVLKTRRIKGRIKTRNT